MRLDEADQPRMLKVSLVTPASKCGTAFRLPFVRPGHSSDPPNSQLALPDIVALSGIASNSV